MKRLIILFSLAIISNSCSFNDANESATIADRPIIGCVPVTTDSEWYKSENIAPLFDGVDIIDFPITTENELVQRYFNQGLSLAYGFNHAEAARSFYYATKLEPTCAMAYWGFAYVLGPNYNAGMESDNYERAYAAIQTALSLSANSTALERDLIEALAKRYMAEAPEDRNDLDLAYSAEMKKVSAEYPHDPNAWTLYAESLMNLHPWDLYAKNGEIREWTPEILSSLEHVLEIDPEHIGANHFYIHAVEMSMTPERGLKSAALFDKGIAPKAGHLIHMPSHIYIRTGDYHKGTLANINAVKEDSVYSTACNAQGAYPLAYYPHNYHFMAGTATLEGNSYWAIKASLFMSSYVDEQIMQEPGWGTLQHYYTIPYYVYVKFGKWDEILEMKNFNENLEYPEAVRHYARGMAYLGKADLVKAELELSKLEAYADDESLKELTIWNINSVYTLMQIARRVLKGEIEASEGNYEASIVLLKEAVEIEDALNYDEPPDWFFSVRHHLGAVQIEAREYEAAIVTYKDDLLRLPKNGWALHGLEQAYMALNDQENLSATVSRLENAWATADIELVSSRIK